MQPNAIASAQTLVIKVGSSLVTNAGRGLDAAAIARWAAQVAELRRLGLRVDTDYAGRSVKGQMTQAGRTGARLVVRVSGETAVLRAEGADVSEAFPLSEITASVLGHPGPPPASEPNGEKRSRGARDVPEG